MNFHGRASPAPHRDDAGDKEHDRPPGRFPSSPDFWRLWLIGALQFGVRWLDTLAVGIFTYQKTGSAFAVAAIMMLRVLPMALFGMFAGAAADRFEGRSILLVTLGVSCATSSMLALLAWSGHLEIWHVAIATFVAGIIWSSDIPLRRLMIGRVVDPAHMAKAMALDSGASNGARMAGPAIGGAVLATFGIAGCFVVGALMFFVAMMTATGIRYRRPLHMAAPGLIIGSIVAAIRLSARDKSLAGYFSITLIYNLFGLPILSLVPVIGQDHLGLGARGIGILAGMDGVGALFGALALFFVARQAHYARIYVYCTLTYVTALMIMCVAPHPAIAGGALIVAGFGSAGFGVMQSTLILRGAKPEMRALLLGLLTVAIGTGPLGLLQIGLLAEVIGAQRAILVSGCEGLLALFMTRRLWRAIKSEESA